MQLEWPDPNREVGLLDVTGAVGLAGFLVARFVPIARLPFWGCALRRATGWPCPGCGLTRVADRMAHGNFAGAWQANPLGTLVAGAFAAAALLTLLHLAFRLPIPRPCPSAREVFWLKVAGAAAIVANYGFILIQTKG